MALIEFSSMAGSREILGLNSFEVRNRHQVDFHAIPWSKAWDELLSIGLRNQGPDVSQVGTTWVGSLAGMQVLHTFSPEEIARISGPHTFFPGAWEGTTVVHEAQRFAVPWVTDTRLLLYRRDLLEKAGVNEESAFGSHAALTDTLERLQAAGVETPLALPTVEENLHNMAPWVWGGGGRFRTPDRRHLMMTDERTIAGMLQFFGLHRFLAPAVRGFTAMEVNQCFLEGRCAVALVDHTPIPQMVFQTPPAFGIERVGAAPTPGIPFVGGSGLVMWRHCIQEAAGLELIQFLLSPEIQRNLFLKAYELPAFSDVLQIEPYASNPLIQVILYSLKNGKAFQSGHHWATVESRFSPLFNQIWVQLFHRPDFNLSEELTRRVSELSERLEKTILAV